LNEQTTEIYREYKIFNVQGVDKEGRGFDWVVFKNIPSSLETRDALRYLMYTMKIQSEASQNPYLEEQVAVFDFEGAGVKNINIGMIREVEAMLANCYPDLLNKQIFIRTGWLVAQTWNIV
jgi:hypothetical protein